MDAAIFKDIVDWNDFSFDGRDFIIIDDTDLGNPYPFEYEHNVSFNPQAASIDSATLTLSHWGNYEEDPFFGAELWLISDSDTEWIGILDDSGWEFGWVDQEFLLPPTLYPIFPADNWSLALKLEEDTGCWDVLKLDKSVLSVTYTAVPIPATVWIFGSGLVGLVGIRRKFKK